MNDKKDIKQAQCVIGNQTIAIKSIAIIDNTAIFQKVSEQLPLSQTLCKSDAEIENLNKNSQGNLPITVEVTNVFACL